MFPKDSFSWKVMTLQGWADSLQEQKTTNFIGNQIGRGFAPVGELAFWESSRHERALGNTPKKIGRGMGSEKNWWDVLHLK